MSEQDTTMPAPVPRFDDRVVRRALRWVTASHLRAVVLLAVVALACFLPGLGGIAPVDRDEPRFAQATRQMLETGDFIDIRLQDEPRYKKPVGIYWLQAATVTLAGQGADAPIWAYRLASVLGGLAAVLLTYWAALPLFGRGAGIIAGLALATSLLLTAEAHLAKTDAALLATVVLAQGALARAYLLRDSERLPFATALLFWVGLGLGFLIKGPIILMVAGLTILALVAADRRAGWLLQLRPVIGAPVALLIVLPWLAAILSIAGLGFLADSVGDDLLGKVATGQESHWGPPGYHLLLFFVLFLPAITLFPLALGPVWRDRRRAAVKFCIAWLVPSWLVFEIVATKLPHYTLPLYPAVAILVGGIAAEGRLVTGRWWTRTAMLPAALLCAGGVAAALVVLGRLEGIVSTAAIVLALLVAALAALAARAGWTDQPLAGGAAIAAAMVLAYGTVLGLVLPAMETFRLSPRIAAAVAEAAACPEPRLVATGYEEPSLVFATATDIRLTNARAAADFLRRDGCRLALVEERREAAFLARAAARGLAVDRIATVTGMNIGRPEPISVGIFRAAGDAGGDAIDSDGR